MRNASQTNSRKHRCVALSRKAFFIEKYKIKSVEYREDGAVISVTVDDVDYNKYKDNVIGVINV